MTNKTITLACPFCGSKELKQVTDDGVHFTQCKSCEATGPTGFKRGEDDAVDWNTRAALADPVPPAGREPEVLGWLIANPNGDFWYASKQQSQNDTELVDRAHVTRLQAEVERLKTMSDNYCSLLMDANSELTKARELFRDIADDPEMWSICSIALARRIDEQLSNQSAPADKAPPLIQALHANGDRIAMEATIAQQAQRIADLEADKGQGEPVATLARKYDDTLMPFVALMRKELHANADKGDRPGWLSMSADTCLLEIIYHFGKLQASVKRGDGDGMAEYGADVANMCMMLLDICGVINLAQHTEQPAPVAVAPFKLISLPPSLIDHHAFDVLRDELAKVGVQVKEPKP